MANDSNKLNDLASNTEDDPTAELESLGAKDHVAAEVNDNLDIDEDTFEFESLEGLAEVAGKSVETLKSDIRSRNQSIRHLQFDIAQLHSRWSGLEEEIKAREELTDKLSEQISEIQQNLARTEMLLSERETDIDALQAGLKERNSQLTSLEKEAKDFHDTVESGKNFIEELQTKVEEQQTTIKKLNEDKLAADAEHKAALEDLSDKDAHIASLLDELSCSAKESERQTLSLSNLKNELHDAVRNHENLRASLENDRAFEEHESQRRLADQEGCIAGNVQEINTLRQQIQRTESYADELRSRLQDMAASSSDDLRHRHQLEASIAAAASQIQELQEQLENEALIGTDLRKQNEQMRCEFDEEIKQVRSELGSAEETIADQENISKQLAADLVDNQEYRQALELQLDGTNKDSKKTIKELSRRLKKLKRAKADIERELENKDSAIATLFNELATRNHAIDSIGEIKNVIHEIDGRMSDRIADNPANEKDRIVRLLIGNIDGQELQFPLFRHRLTIGRTERNDIQLKAEFISRRHAVIVTENEQTRIIDWGSKNGVYVNHSRVAEQILRNGDIVAIGTAEFRYEERTKR